MIAFPEPITERPDEYELDAFSPTARGLAAWWPGKHPGGESLHDMSGNVHTGTWNGTGAHWVSDGVRQGIVQSYNGSDDRAIGPASTAIIPNGANVLTLSAWCAYTYGDATPTRRIFTLHRLDAGGSKIGLETTSGTLGIWYKDAGNGTSTLYSAGAYNDGAWHHVAATCDGTNLVVYVDGVSVGSASDGLIGATGTKEMAIGGFWADDTSNAWDGKIDDPRIYTRALSAAEIAHIYHAGRVAPLSDLAEPSEWDIFGAPSGVVVPTKPGLQWTLPANPIDWTPEPNPVEWTPEKNLPEWTLDKE